MSFIDLAKVAVELGVVPCVALFLVFAMHLQNKHLIEMLDQREKNNFDILKMLIHQQLMELSSEGGEQKPRPPKPGETKAKRVRGANGPRGVSEEKGN
jgi:hypothetical protein